GFALSLHDLIGQLTEYRGTRIGRLIYATAESHDPLLALERLTHPLRRILTALLDLSQSLHHAHVGTAMCRALERADRGNNRRVDVREACRSHPGGEGRGVPAMLGVKHQGSIERPYPQLVGFLAIEHVEEVRRSREAFLGSDDLETLPRPVER